MNRIAAYAAATVVICFPTGLFAQQPDKLGPEPNTQAQLQEEFLSWKFGMFIHFNLGTFVGREWANGYEDPDLFNPGKLDCGQWADAATAAGMKYAVLTAKHTEGYALWPSKYTTHNMSAFKNYKGGKGDIVREFVNAFRKRGVKVGLYYCFPGDYSGSGATSTLPAGKPDLHGVPPEGQGDYVGFVNKQLAELLTGYGPIDLLWIDQHDNPYTGMKWQEIKAHIKKLQPNCILLANSNLDFKVADIHSYEYPWLKEHDPDRTKPKEDNKAAAELNDCILMTGNWFWHSDQKESYLQKAEDVVAMLHLCNARRTNYLLDVPPDNTGLIPAYSVMRLKEIGVMQESKVTPKLK